MPLLPTYFAVLCHLVKTSPLEPIHVELHRGGIGLLDEHLKAALVQETIHVLVAFHEHFALHHVELFELGGSGTLLVVRAALLGDILEESNAISFAAFPLGGVVLSQATSNLFLNVGISPGEPGIKSDPFLVTRLQFIEKLSARKVILLRSLIHLTCVRGESKSSRGDCGLRNHRVEPAV